jgi:hypothetical protein
MKKIFLLSLLSLTICLSNVIASKADDSVLPGDEKKESDLINPTIDIVIGKFIALGVMGDPDGGGVRYYQKGKIEIISILRGTLSGDILVSYLQKSFAIDHKEVGPSIAVDYIFFIKNQTIEPDEYELEKVLPASNEDVARIKALIVSQTAH